MVNGSPLTDGFRDIIELRWDEFVQLERAPDATNFDSVVCAMVRGGVKGNLRAIQLALDRLDGKIATELAVEYPKFYTLYPNATIAADDPEIIDPDEIARFNEQQQRLKHLGGAVEVVSGAADLDELAAEADELPTGSLRVVLERMLHSPRSVVDIVLDAAKHVDDGQLVSQPPQVKSVLVAGLMRLVHEGRVNAVFEVFDQIDGKVADKIKLLGNDVFIKRWDEIAPAGAVKNADGIYQIENDNTSDVWAARLGAGKDKR